MKVKYFLFLVLVFCFYCPFVFALDFPISLNTDGRDVIGKIQVVDIKAGDTYSKIAQKYDVGYYELVEANPNVNPYSIKIGTKLIVPTYYVLPKELNDNIVINLAELRLYYESSKLHKIFVYPIGIGRRNWNTPVLKTDISAKIKDPAWYVPKSINDYRLEHEGKALPRVVPPGPDNPLGKYALKLGNTGYFIHGTDDILGIGRRSSAGCIRMYPEDIEQLFSMVKRGTGVIIINQPYKFAYEEGKIFVEAHYPLYEQREVIGNDLSKVAQNLFNRIDRLNSITINLSRLLLVVSEHLGIPEVVGKIANQRLS